MLELEGAQAENRSDALNNHSELNMDETIPLAYDRKELDLTAMMTERELINSLGPEENQHEPQLELDDDDEDIDAPVTKGNRSRSQKSIKISMPVTPMSRL